MKLRLLILLGISLLVFSCSPDYVRPPSPGAMIKTFKLTEGQVGEARLNMNERKITVTVQSSDLLKSIKPVITISDGASISPASGQTIDVSSTKKQQFSVKAESGKVNEWVVEFIVYGDLPDNYGVYKIASNANGRTLQIAGDILYNQKYNEGQTIELAEPDDNGKTLWQKWHLVLAKTEGNVKYYNIRNLHSGKLLAALQTSAGSTLQQKRANGADNELWGIAPGNGGDNICSIINKQSGLALTADATTPVKLTQNALDGSKNQQWVLLHLTRVSVFPWLTGAYSG
jgi:hypothetical protein